jgi:hypothetical protein
VGKKFRFMSVIFFFLELSLDGTESQCCKCDGWSSILYHFILDLMQDIIYSGCAYIEMYYT